MPMNYDRLFRRLKGSGITTYRIRKEKLVSETTLTALRQGRPVSTEALCRFCAVLSCQPGDLMEYIPDDAPAPDPTITL